MQELTMLRLDYMIKSNITAAQGIMKEGYYNSKVPS